MKINRSILSLSFKGLSRNIKLRFLIGKLYSTCKGYKRTRDVMLICLAVEQDASVSITVVLRGYNAESRARF